MKDQRNNEYSTPIQWATTMVKVSLLFVLAGCIGIMILLDQEGEIELQGVMGAVVNGSKAEVKPQILSGVETGWIAPHTSSIPSGNAGEQIRYGRELIAHTAVYLGPKGRIGKLSNGMNCQNCHNDAGRKTWALNYSAVASTYPQFKARSNEVVSIADRINGCFQRSLNGKKLDTMTKEMQAMIAYMKWLGKDVAKGVKPERNAVEKLPFMERAASLQNGRIAYNNLCMSCHGKNGEGKINDSGTEYVFPPLWGPHSYNDGAGLYRLSNFAGFVKNNMPFGCSYEHPMLSDEEAWDLAAFVNSQPRPHKDQSTDWKDISKKPFDFPFGPYKDKFSQEAHKYGPFKPIIKNL